MYNDFINEIVAKQTESGKTPRPNDNNAISSNRRRLRNKIEATAAELDKDPADVALDYVNQNIGTLQRYVTTSGEQPLQNPAELATQAYLLRQKDIETVQNIIGCNRQDAETYLDESEAKAIEMNDSDADNFLGEIFEAVGRVAGKGLQKIADKREAAGKKPGVFGFLAKLTAPNPNVLTTQQEGGNGLNLGGIGVAAKDVLESIKDAEKKKEINKLLPFIIIGVIVLILTVVLITRNATKH
jgi:hypothetical protein